MKNISPANNPFVKTPSTKPAISRNKKVICSQKSVVNNKRQGRHPLGSFETLFVSKTQTAQAALYNDSS
jgi:hypothetical protein